MNKYLVLSDNVLFPLVPCEPAKITCVIYNKSDVKIDTGHLVSYNTSNATINK